MDRLNKTHRFTLFGISVCIIVLYAFLAVQPDLRKAVLFLVLTSAGVTILLVLMIYMTERDDGRVPAVLILGVGALIRLMFVFRSPELSDDVFRYLWDGLRMLPGNNPYTLAPAAVLPQDPEMAKMLASVNHPDLVTIYPPGAQAVFLWAAALSRRVWGIKCLLILMDMGSCAMIIHLLLRYEMPAGRCILYAWHPLVVLEVSGSGHIDAAGIFFFLLSLTTIAGRFDAPSLYGKSKSRLSVMVSGAFYAWSCLIKLFPVVFFPFFLKYAGRQNRTLFLAGAIAGGLLLCLPFLPHLQNMFTTLFHYARHWEFSGFSFFWLRRLGLSGDLSRVILLAAFLTTVAAVGIKAFTPISASNSSMRLTDFFYPLYWINLAFLFLSPTLHPWYALYLVSLLPFVPRTTGLILSWSVLLAYSVLIPYVLTGQWVENPLATTLIWVGPATALVVRPMIAWIFQAALLPGRGSAPP